MYVEAKACLELVKTRFLHTKLEAKACLGTSLNLKTLVEVCD